MTPPAIADSTREERRAYIEATYPCISDCDLCGNCAAFHGREPTVAFLDYIEGRADFATVMARYRPRGA